MMRLFLLVTNVRNREVLKWGFVLFFETGSHVAQVGLKLAMYLRMSFKSCSFTFTSRVLGLQACYRTLSQDSFYVVDLVVLT